MSSERVREFRSEAEHERNAGDLVAAGDYYSREGFELAAHGVSIHGNAGGELRPFLEACTCYRVGDAHRWCRKRARMGELLAEEIAERVVDRPTPAHDIDHAQRGVWYEYIGDLRTVGQYDDADGPYERAKSVYREANDPPTSAAEQAQRAIMAYFFSVARAAGADMDPIYETTRRQPLTEWLAFKRSRLPSMLETLEETGAYPLTDPE